MKQTTTVCDACGAKDIRGELHVVANPPARHDAPGVKEEPSAEVDLCLTCCKRELNRFLSPQSPGVRLAWCVSVKQRRYPKNEEVE